MKKTAAYFTFLISLIIASCGSPADYDNRGAHGSMDKNSNTDRDIPTAGQSNGSAQEKQDTSAVNGVETHGGQIETQNPNGNPPNQAPNNGEGNPKKSINGQSGTNQTGQ